jgi:peptidoglycan hydrolase-like protein with peptidoglycan-binding domain
MTVQLGTRGTPANCVERRLVQLGYWLSGPDTNFDSTAVTALKNFQTKYSLPSNGIADQATLEVLEIWTAPRPLPAPTCRVFMTVRLGTRGDPALCVETRLTQLGYWLAGPNDNFDSTGVNALRAFQTKYGLLNDGIAAKTTLVAMGIWVEPRPMPAATCWTSWPVVEGGVGYPARCVETRLAQLGYWLIGPNDTFDASGANALRAFQRKWGLASTGWADYYTLVKLGIHRKLERPAATCTTHYAVYPGSTGAGARCVEERGCALPTAGSTRPGSPRCEISSTRTGWSATAWPGGAR